MEDAALRAEEIHVRDKEEQRKIIVGNITLNAADFPPEFDIALTLLCRFPESPIVQAHGQVDTVAYIPKGLDIKLTEALDQAKRQAIVAFAPLVAAMRFQSESVSGLKLK